MFANPPSVELLVETSGSCEGLFVLLERAVASGAQSLLVLAADANGFTPTQLDTHLQALPIPVFGGIFPEIIANGQNLKRGSLVCALSIRAEVHLIEHLSSSEYDHFPVVADLETRIPAGSTLVTLVDGLSKRITAVLENIYDVFGGRYHYLGGGAGSLSFIQKPCLMSNHGLIMDCAQITALSAPVSLGIEHGWHKFAGPFFVTGAYDNIITTINYRPAFEIYRQVVEEDSGQRFEDNNFFDLAKAYPFGLDRVSGVIVVRDPLMHKGNALVCVGEVPINHIIYILKGDVENLLEASQRCVQMAQTDTSPCFALLFDCISRTLFLQERFAEEIANIYQALPPEVPLIGALSLGEIADAGNTGLELFNKTLVLGILSLTEQRL